MAAVEETAWSEALRNILTLGIILVACALALSSPGSLADSPARKTLWLTVQACVADYQLIGSPFPCLQVNLNGGQDRGYIVLRDRGDTILAPTRKVVGIEDPWLQTPDAPNYFDDAWRARPLLAGPDGRPPPPENFALAVNSKFTRSQDQLHIHMGCLAPEVKRWLPGLAPKLPVGVWTRVGVPIAGSSFLAMRTGRAPGTDVEPFRLAAEAMGGKTNLARMTLLVTEARIGETDEALIFASYAGESGPVHELRAETMLDLTCAGLPRASVAE